MKVKGFSGDGFASNCYLILDRNEAHAIAVDPSIPYTAVSATLASPPVIDAIVLTHAHADHLLALDDWRRATHAPVLIGAGDADALSDPRKSCALLLGLGEVSYGQADRILTDGEGLPLGDELLTVISTPGHSPGSLCLIGNDFLISGDTLFANGGVGRTDFAGGSRSLLARSVAGLLRLSGDTAVYPGHGPATTIGREARYHQHLLNYKD